MFNSKQNIVLLLSVMLYSTMSLAAQPLNDPMRPPGKTTHSGSKKVGTSARNKDNGFYLNAIRITKDQRSANINGRHVNVGERIGAAKVVSIQASSVTLQQAGKTIALSLLPLSIKKPVEAIQP